MTSLTPLVRPGQTVRFLTAYADHLWYVAADGSVFPVRFDDIGDATFLAQDKALLFLRYLRAQAERPAPFQIKLASPRDVGIGPAVVFTHYRQGWLWYKTPDRESFPVPRAACQAHAFPARAPLGPLFQEHLVTHRAMLASERRIAAEDQPLAM